MVLKEAPKTDSKEPESNLRRPLSPAVDAMIGLYESHYGKHRDTYTPALRYFLNPETIKMMVEGDRLNTNLTMAKEYKRRYNGVAVVSEAMDKVIAIYERALAEKEAKNAVKPA